MKTKNIKEVAKKILIEITPPIFFRIYRIFKRPHSVQEESYQTIDEDISRIKTKLQIQENQESLIIGNGTSFKHFIYNHQEFIKNKICFCVNSFVESEYYELVKPSYYIFADPVYWNPNCSVKLKTLVDRIYKELETKTAWPITLLLPTYAKTWNWFNNLPDRNKNISIAYYNIVTCDEQRSDKFELYKNNKAMPVAQTVLVSAIFISINLGFKTNYVIGGDLSLHEGIYVDKNNIVCYTDKHFYDNEPSESMPFWKDAEHTTVWRMDEIFMAFSRMFKGFRELENYSNFLNVKIYNLSISSYIDSFEKLKI
jgi:hypothetical protein